MGDRRGFKKPTRNKLPHPPPQPKHPTVDIILFKTISDLLLILRAPPPLVEGQETKQEYTKLHVLSGNGSVGKKIPVNKFCLRNVLP